MHLELLFVVVLSVWLGSAQNVIDTCDCNPIGSLSSVCGVNGQCECKPGVGGLQCDQCLPGYTELGDSGCRLQSDCECHPTGSLTDVCDENERCTCQLGFRGDKCDACQDGHHRVDLGCISCPSCFDDVTVQFNLTIRLYSSLLQRLNETISTNTSEGSGLTLEEVTQYQSLLTDLLRRAINATQREDDLSQILTDLQSKLTSLNVIANLVDANITIAMATLDSLTTHANNTRSAFEELLLLVEALETRVTTEIRMQLRDAVELVEQLRNEFQALVGLATEADQVSWQQETQAADLLQQANTTLSAATTALQQLDEAVFIQNRTRVLVEMIRNGTLERLESLHAQGVAVLDSTQSSVPTALENSIRTLTSVRNISIPEFSLESREDRLSLLRNATESLFDSIAQLDASLDLLRTNFTEYNETATRLLSESISLNSEATELLSFAQTSFTSANDSVTNGNSVIQEARRLLMEVQDRLRVGRDFTAGLEGVLRNIELAESRSLEAEEVTTGRGRELVVAIATANRAATLLGGATTTLGRAFELATGANLTANQVLSEARVLSDAAVQFAGGVAQAEDDINQLEEAVNNDTDAIAMVSETARETISAASNLTVRLTAVRDSLANLTTLFKSISLIPPERLQAINSTLSRLEEDSSANQILVDSLTNQVRQLQESADELRARYTEVQQHRDLLQSILRNVEDLDCRSQFERA